MNPITEINMKRMLARIDIRNNSVTSNFMVEEVYLANYNTTGYIAPAWNTNGQVTEPAPDTPVLPTGSGKMTEEGNAILYSVIESCVFGKQSLGPFYCGSAFTEHSFSLGYGVILQSSLAIVLSLTLGFSPYPCVSIFGTGRVQLC